MTFLKVEQLSIHAEKEEGDIRLLKSVSLEMEKGERTALLGYSGSGKTTLANAIMGFLKADTFCDYGTVTYDGIVNVPKQLGLDFLDNDPFEDIRGKRMAYVMQNVKDAFDPTEKIGTYIAELFPEEGFFERQKKVISFLEKAGISDPKKVSRSSPQEVSVGELQKIMIMTALAKDPELVILDEPFSALDPLSKQQMIEELQKHESMGILLITHEPETAKNLCTSCLFMAEGKVSEKRNTADLSTQEMVSCMEV
ncbi:MAG: ABC transporter ATP-binding protein [Solobacterium sp.]|nr:ABC transporter ATP-binding protein [Solobacterium sp.]